MLQTTHPVSVAAPGQKYWYSQEVEYRVVGVMEYPSSKRGSGKIVCKIASIEPNFLDCLTNYVFSQE